MEALVIGGTGPTGPHIVEGLVERGYRTTILHAGQHEVEFTAAVEHIHEDPHFEETLARGLGSRTFDLVVAQYGRLRIIANVLAGRTGRLVAIGGATGIYGSATDGRWGTAGKPELFPETTPVYASPEHGSTERSASGWSRRWTTCSTTTSAGTTGDVRRLPGQLRAAQPRPV